MLYFARSVMSRGFFSHNLTQRTLTACVLASVVIYLLFFAPTLVAFQCFLIICGAAMMGEYIRLVRGASLPDMWLPLGLVYTLPSAFSIWWLVGLEGGRELVFFLALYVALTDTGAYICGKMWGRHKLAPRISPAKTWEGLIGGVLLAYAVGLWLLWLPGFGVHVQHGLAVWLLLPLLSVLAQLGDLSESWLKRRAGVKDSSHLLPGHGGVLDRFDGFLISAPYFALLVYTHVLR